MAAGKKVTKPTNKRRSGAPPEPELKIDYQPAGRDTLAAIEEELHGSGARPERAPLIEISEAPAGRETMEAIAEELSVGMRPRQNTLPYGDRIRNAPGARSPSRAPAPRGAAVPPAATNMADDGPEVTVSSEAPLASPQATPAALEIFELLTFIVRGGKVSDLSTDALRRRFVEENLLARVPSGSMSNVERIEVTPWTAKGTMVLRIWCRA